MPLRFVSRALPLALLIALPIHAADASALDPAAIDALERMSSYLASLQSFSLRAAMATDLVLESGQKVQVDNTVEMAVRKPNHLYVESYSASHLRELTYDGKALTIYGEPSKYYASVPTGKTIAELIDIAAKKYGIELPLADLFFWGSAQRAKLESAVRIGPERLDGKVCQLYAFRQEGADWQACITDGKQALPLKLVVTTINDPVQPQNVYRLQWQTSPKFSADLFTFTPPKGAQRIELAPLPAAK